MPKKRLHRASGVPTESEHRCWLCSEVPRDTRNPSSSQAQVFSQEFQTILGQLPHGGRTPASLGQNGGRWHKISAGSVSNWMVRCHCLRFGLIEVPSYTLTTRSKRAFKSILPANAKQLPYRNPGTQHNVTNAGSFSGRSNVRT